MVVRRGRESGGLLGGARRSVRGKERENPENGKMEFDCRYTCLKITFLNWLEAESKNTPIGGSVLNLFLYISLINLYTVFYSKIWCKFEFRLLTKV